MPIANCGNYWLTEGRRRLSDYWTTSRFTAQYNDLVMLALIFPTRRHTKQIWLTCSLRHPCFWAYPPRGQVGTTAYALPQSILMLHCHHSNHPKSTLFESRTWALGRFPRGTRALSCILLGIQPAATATSRTGCTEDRVEEEKARPPLAAVFVGSVQRHAMNVLAPPDALSSYSARSRARQTSSQLSAHLVPHVSRMLHQQDM